MLGTKPGSSAGAASGQVVLPTRPSLQPQILFINISFPTLVFNNMYKDCKAKCMSYITAVKRHHDHGNIKEDIHWG